MTGLPKFPVNELMSILDNSPLYDLGESTSFNLSMAALLDAEMINTLRSTQLTYSTPQGLPVLRQLVGEKLQVSPENVLITAGALTGIFLNMLALCHPDDEIVTVSPNFPPTLDLIEVLAAVKKTVHLRFDRQYEPDIQELEALLSERTRLVILVSPSNPSGKQVSEAHIRQVAALLEARCPGAWLLVDETFRDAAYGNLPTPASFAGYGKNVLAVGSVSKAHGAPGLRIGWVVCQDKDLLQQLITAKVDTGISGSIVDEWLAVAVLRKETAILQQRRDWLAAALAVVAAWINRNEALVEWIRPDAGAFCAVRLKPGKFTPGQVQLFYQALPGAGIQVANGAWFKDEARVFRLGFGTLPLPMLEQALQQLEQVLQSVAG